jgi:hypothetical protein
LYGVNCDGECWIEFCMCLITVIFLGNYCSLFYDPFCRQVQWLTPSIAGAVSECIELGTYYSIICLNQFYWNLINTWWCICVRFFNNHLSPSKAQGWGTSDSALCIHISFCLTWLTPRTFSNRSDPSTCSEYWGNLQLADHHSDLLLSCNLWPCTNVSFSCSYCLFGVQ